MITNGISLVGGDGEGFACGSRVLYLSTYAASSGCPSFSCSLCRLGNYGPGAASQRLLSPKTPGGLRYLSLLEDVMPSKTSAHDGPYRSAGALLSASVPRIARTRTSFVSWPGERGWSLI
jgi:hypothetical protein